MAGAVGARFDSSSDSDGLVYRTEDEALKAVKENGRNLRNVPLEFRWPELCEEAVKQTAFALEWVPQDFRTEELCLMAVTKNGYVLMWVPEKVRTVEVCRAALFSEQTAEAASLDVEDHIKRFMRYIPEEFQWVRAALNDGYVLTVLHCDQTWAVWVTDIAGITLTTVQAQPQQKLADLLVLLQTQLEEEDYTFHMKFIGQNGTSLMSWDGEELLQDVMPLTVSKPPSEHQL